MDAFDSALDQAAAIKRGDYSPAELAAMYRERIAKLNPALNHYVLETPEIEGRTGDSNLAGVAWSVKDLISIGGLPTTLGSAAFEDLVLPVDFFPVTQIKSSGGAILGKTNCSEFGTRPVTEYGLFGAAHNPWSLEHTTGGSSGGAAGAVAAGLCSVAHGTDGAGRRQDHDPGDHGDPRIGRSVPP